MPCVSHAVLYDSSRTTRSSLFRPPLVLWSLADSHRHRANRRCWYNSTWRIFFQMIGVCFTTFGVFSALVVVYQHRRRTGHWCCAKLVKVPVKRILHLPSPVIATDITPLSIAAVQASI